MKELPKSLHNFIGLGDLFGEPVSCFGVKIFDVGDPNVVFLNFPTRPAVGEGVLAPGSEASGCLSAFVEPEPVECEDADAIPCEVPVVGAL